MMTKKADEKHSRNVLDYFSSQLIVMLFGLFLGLIGLLIQDEGLRGFGIGMIFASFLISIGGVVID